MIKLNVRDETSNLKTVVVGIGKESGETPKLSEAYDAKSYNTILNGKYPNDDDLDFEVESFKKLLEKEGVEVLRPSHIQDCNQIFSRDVAFVIDNVLIKANIIPDREDEMAAYSTIFSKIASDHIITPPDYVHIEGGDVLLYNDYIFLGTYLSPDYPNYKMARTNKYAIGFLKDIFPQKEIIPLQLCKHDTDPYVGVLHLDCCFQPVGKDKALLYPGAFRNKEDYEFIIDFFGPENTFIITKQEMFEMNTNIFSISPTKVIIDSTFDRLAQKLKSWNITPLLTPYREVSKLGGLLRCTTMPLIRE